MSDMSIDTIVAMCKQEQSHYMPPNYLSQSTTTNASSHQETGNLPQHVMVDIDCREKMVSWCFQVVDFCKFQRETVSIAINYLDRFMGSKVGQDMAMGDRKVFQLAAMTCLYTAVKIHEPEAMDPKLVSTLSRGTYQPEEVEAMEATILMAIGWRVNPPTALAFVRAFLDLLSEDVLTKAQRETVYELSKFQTELAVSEYDFLAVRPSAVAFASLVNALESMGVIDASLLARISYGLADLIHIELGCDQVFEVQNWLYQAISNQTTNFIKESSPASSSSTNKAKAGSSFDTSPRAVHAQ